MKIIQITDFHLVPRGQTLFDLDPQARLDAAISSINENHADADLCMCTGDIAHLGEPEAYALAHDRLSRLKVPCHCMIGNHDDREAFKSVFTETPVDGHGFVQYVLDVPVGRFVVLDTVDAGEQPGLLCDVRLAWLRDRLEEARGRSVYLFMHHPPLHVGIAAVDRIWLRNAEAFAEIIAGYPDIRHIFFGHVHRTTHGSWYGIPFSALKATAYQMALNLVAGSAMLASRESPSYAVIFLSDQAVIVHDHSYLEEGLAFAKRPHGPQPQS